MDEPEAAVVRRIRKLLALAESANPHEAEAAARAAHKQLRKHNISVVDDPASFGARCVGRVALRHQAHEKVLAGLLGRHFFVHPVWVSAWMAGRDRWGKVLEICGRPENLDLAVHAHAFVIDTAERAWRIHKRQRGSAGRQRGRFLAGVVMGFGEQLDDQADTCEQTGLVWVGDAQLDDWVGRRFPRLRTTRGTRIRADGAFQR